MGMYDSFYDEDSDCPKCHTKVKDGWQTKRLESLLENWKKGNFLQYRKVIKNPDWKPGRGLAGLAGMLKRIDEPVSKKPIIDNGKVPVYTSCNNCKAWLEAYAKITNGRFVGIVEVEADGDPKELFIIKPETTAKMLRDEFHRKLSHMQQSCKHKRTQWMEYQWAPGHFAGQVRVCLRCEKITDRKKGWKADQDSKQPKKMDYDDVLRFPTRKPIRNMDLFHQASGPTRITSDDLSRELRKGRAEDRKREQALKRRHS